MALSQKNYDFCTSVSSERARQQFWESANSEASAAQSFGSPDATADATAEAFSKYSILVKAAIEKNDSTLSFIVLILSST